MNMVLRAATISDIPHPLHAYWRWVPLGKRFEAEYWLEQLYAAEWRLRGCRRSPEWISG